MSDALLDLDPDGNAAQAQRIQLNAKDVAPEPGVFQNFAPAVGNHTMRAAANVGRTVAILSAAPAVAIEKMTGTEGQTSDAIFKAVDDYFNPAVDYWTPKASETGKAGQIVGGLVEGIAPLALGPAGVPAMLGNAQVGTSTDLMREGVDADTALKVGLAASTSNAVGFKIPFLGKTLVSRIASGAAGNLAVNTGATVVQNKTLEGKGYTEAAKQFDATNGEARALDVLMGAAFGVVTHASAPRPTTAQGDAILATRNAKNFQQDSAPGVPKDVASSAAHQNNMEQAMLQLMRGEKVDLASTIQEADFLKPPAAMKETPTAVAVREAIADMRPADAPVLPLSGSRGVRNNNPGNIQKSATPWSGKVDGTDARFETFDTPESGIRALAKNLLSYQDKHGLNTIQDIVTRWAPASENNTAAYVAAVAKDTKLDPTQPLNLRDGDTLKRITAAVIKHENGGNPYSDSVVQAGIGKALGSVPVENAGAVVRSQLASRADVPAAAKESIAKEYEAAAAQKPKFDMQVQDIAHELGITRAPLIPEELKGVDRATAKIMGDYGGDATKIKDLTRATLVVDSPEQAMAVINSAQGKFGDLHGLRNALMPDSAPTSPAGYRDVKMNIRLGDHTAELQVNVPEMIEAKKQAHGLYEQAEALDRILMRENREPTLAEAAQKRELRDQQRAIYDAAWSSFLTRSRKATSETKVPLWSKEEDGNLRGSGLSQARQTNSGVQDTGTPSTSANRVPGGNDSGNAISTSTASSLPQGVPGRKSAVVTERGQQVPVQYLVSEADYLITSHDNALKPNPAFPTELQPRDRARAASEAQISKIENGINPELLADSPKASDGAPIIGRDGVVESGNARTIALRRAYDGGKAVAYREWLLSNADRFGLDRTAIEKMQRPVLTRVGIEAYDRAEFARQANESSVAHMSSTEIAQSDAARMPDLSELHTGEDGSINMARSMGFVRAFINQAVSPSERGGMMTASGDLSQDGVKRIRNAVFAKAYGDPDIVAMMGESTDANVKNILNGMMRAAPEVARMRDLVESGARHPMDIAPDLVRAVREFSNLRSEGKTVEQHLSQFSLLGDGLSPEVTNLLQGLQDNARAPKRIAEMIGKFTDMVDQLGDPRQRGVFDDTAPQAHELMASTVEGMQKENASALPATPEINAMKKIAQDDPGAMVLEGYDADGNPKYTSVREAVAQIEAEHTEQLKEAQSYDAAVNCLLRRGG